MNIARNVDVLLGEYQDMSIVLESMVCLDVHGSFTRAVSFVLSLSLLRNANEHPHRSNCNRE